MKKPCLAPLIVLAMLPLVAAQPVPAISSARALLRQRVPPVVARLQQTHRAR